MVYSEPEFLVHKTVNLENETFTQPCTLTLIYLPHLIMQSVLFIFCLDAGIFFS